MGPVLAALDGAPGRRLLDLGGGTGNYAVALRGDLDAGAEAELAGRRLPHGDGVVIAWTA